MEKLIGTGIVVAIWLLAREYVFQYNAHVVIALACCLSNVIGFIEGGISYERWLEREEKRKF